MTVEANNLLPENKMFERRATEVVHDCGSEICDSRFKARVPSSALLI